MSGEVESPVRLKWDEFNRLQRTSHTQDIHCVTRWSRLDVTFEGVHLTYDDRPGFWEWYGYHNDANPFEEERYGF